MDNQNLLSYEKIENLLAPMLIVEVNISSEWGFIAKVLKQQSNSNYMLDNFKKLYECYKKLKKEDISPPAKDIWDRQSSEDNKINLWKNLRYHIKKRYNGQYRFWKNRYDEKDPIDILVEGFYPDEIAEAFYNRFANDYSYSYSKKIWSKDSQKIELESLFRDIYNFLKEELISYIDEQKEYKRLERSSITPDETKQKQYDHNIKTANLARKNITNIKFRKDIAFLLRAYYGNHEDEECNEEKDYKKLFLDWFYSNYEKEEENYIEIKDIIVKFMSSDIFVKLKKREKELLSQCYIRDTLITELENDYIHVLDKRINGIRHYKRNLLKSWKKI